MRPLRLPTQGASRDLHPHGQHAHQAVVSAVSPGEAHPNHLPNAPRPGVHALALPQTPVARAPRSTSGRYQTRPTERRSTGCGTLGSGFSSRSPACSDALPTAEQSRLPCEKGEPPHWASSRFPSRRRLAHDAVHARPASRGEAQEGTPPPGRCCGTAPEQSPPGLSRPRGSTGSRHRLQTRAKGQRSQ